ncbi:MAG TPA: OmpA family protein [Microlunatus sp.]|nr:OmpA family protein [Microlunatus sp.]
MSHDHPPPSPQRASALAHRRPGGRMMGALLATTLGLGIVATPAASAEPVALVLDIRTEVTDIVDASADLRRRVTLEQAPGTVRVTLDATVLFRRDSAVIRPTAARRLADVAQRLRSRGHGRVRIVGYTDDLGPAAHGRALSLGRARAVATLLESQLPASGYALTTLGRGEADPAVPNTSEGNRRLNRRVVITYVRT